MDQRKMGLVISNTYKLTPIKLNFAENDAREIKKALEERPYYEFVFGEPFIDKDHTDVFKKIERLLKEADQGDTVLIYFSGHGKLDDEGKLCLMFNETETDLLLATSLPFEFINRLIKKSRCENIITILDCCYSGAVDERGEDIEQKVEQNLEASANAAGSGKIILTASTKYQMSKEDTELKHGVFTNYLLEGLKSEKVADKHGYITISSLYNYAHKKTKDRNPEQEPLMKGTFKGEIIIGKNPKIIKIITYKEKRRKLIEKHEQEGLTIELYNEAMEILSKEKDDPSSLTYIENKIKTYLEELLNNKIGTKTYINTIEGLKEKSEELNSYAKSLFDGKKYAEAIDKWKEVLNLDPKNKTAKDGIEETEQILKELDENQELIDELNSSARQLFDNGHYPQAIDKWKEVLLLNHQNEIALNGKKNAETKLELKIANVIDIDALVSKILEEEDIEKI